MSKRYPDDNPEATAECSLGRKPSLFYASFSATPASLPGTVKQFSRLATYPRIQPFFRGCRPTAAYGGSGPATTRTVVEPALLAGQTAAPAGQAGRGRFKLATCVEQRGRKPQESRSNSVCQPRRGDRELIKRPRACTVESHACFYTRTHAGSPAFVRIAPPAASGGRRGDTDGGNAAAFDLETNVKLQGASPWPLTKKPVAPNRPRPEDDLYAP